MVYSYLNIDQGYDSVDIKYLNRYLYIFNDFATNNYFHFTNKCLTIMFGLGIKLQISKGRKTAQAFIRKRCP